MNDEVSDLAVIEAALKAAAEHIERTGYAPWKDVIWPAIEGSVELVERVKVAEAERGLAIREARLSREATGKQVRSRRRFEARARSAEAAIERVRALADRLKAAGITSVYESAQELGEMIADALDGDA